METTTENPLPCTSNPVNHFLKLPRFESPQLLAGAILKLSSETPRTIRLAKKALALPSKAAPMLGDTWGNRTIASFLKKTHLAVLGVLCLRDVPRSHW